MSTPNPMSELAEARERFLKEMGICEHICSGNCRRRGCNCKCGEFHIVDMNEAFKQWIEETK